jgi:predicted AlkP superfamily phosphohydrolase/phosphomutase
VSPAARTLVIGLDACDATTVEAMMASGDAPVMASLAEHGARCRVRTPYGLYVGAVWPAVATGLSPVRHRRTCWDEIDPVTYERRLAVVPDEPPVPFWVTASDAGRRVAVLDFPHDHVVRPVDGIVLAEWGCHDRHFGLHGWPAGAADEVESAYGLHPVLGIDPRTARSFAPDDYVFRAGPYRTLDEDHALLAGLTDGLDAKRRLSLGLLAEGGWDLFVTVFGESHAVGHQQWHLHDPSHPRFDPAVRDSLGADPIEALYRRLDAAVGDLVAAAGADATVFVFLSHGMGSHFDGTHLLDEVLHRIDLVDRGSGLGSGAWGAAKRATGRLPRPVQRFATMAATPVVRRALRGRAPEPGREFVTAEERAAQRFFLEPNNYCVGGIRFNLAGREAAGCVHPAEVGELTDALRADLCALVNVDTGGPVVRAVEPVGRWYERGVGADTMPDLFVEWERSTLVETVWSPKIGVVHVPYTNWRTGDHRPDGLLFARGPGFPSGKLLPDIAAEDLGMTVLASLGVDSGDDRDGHARPWLVPAAY